MWDDKWTRREFLSRAGRASGAAILTIGALGQASDLWGAAAVEPSKVVGGMSEDRLERILAEIVASLEQKVPYASALYSENSSFSMGNRNGQKTGDRSAVEAGVVLRAYNGREFVEISTSEVTDSSLSALGKRLKNEVSVHSQEKWAVSPGDALERQWMSDGYVSPDELQLDAWRDRADEIFERVEGLDTRVGSTSVRVSANWNRTLFVNRDRKLRQALLRTGLRVGLFGSDDGKQGRAFLSTQVQGNLSAATLSPGQLERLEQELNDTFRSERIPPGNYHILSAPEITGLLAHESFGHGVEYDQFIKGRAKAAHFLGQRVAPEWVQILDDPSYPRENGSYFFDDEGWESSPTEIVKDGIFVQPITDQFSAAAGNMRRTANGRRQSFSHKAYSRMSNTFFGAGESSLEEMMAAIDDGVLLTGFQSGMEDPHGWGIQLVCRLGYEIKGGEKTGKVYSPVSVGGYVPDILNSISHVGTDVVLDPGTCGKGNKEWVPVGSGGPHIVLKANLG